MEGGSRGREGREGGEGWREGVEGGRGGREGVEGGRGGVERGSGGEGGREWKGKEAITSVSLEGEWRMEEWECCLCCVTDNLVVLPSGYMNTYHSR